MIEILTDYPIAVDSDDHQYPEGVYWDNNVNIDFVNEIEEYFDGEKIRFADLGCAGGALSVTMYERGHKSIGIDGSNKMLVLDKDSIKQSTQLHGSNDNNFIPLGHHNWLKYYNKVLFNCDLSKQYTILEENKPMNFDMITSWDVMEHFKPEDIDNVIYQIQKHIKKGGIFVASIAKWDAVVDIEGKNLNINYHKSVFDDDWWLSKLGIYFNNKDYPFSVTNRFDVWDRHLKYFGIKK